MMMMTGIVMLGLDGAGSVSIDQMQVVHQLTLF
jgi:hypothetical protein